MNIGDRVLVKGKVTEIRQTEKGYWLKIIPEYTHAKPIGFSDEFSVNEEAVEFETDYQQMIIDEVSHG